MHSPRPLRRVDVSVRHRPRASRQGRFLRAVSSPVAGSENGARWDPDPAGRGTVRRSRTGPGPPAPHMAARTPLSVCSDECQRLTDHLSGRVLNP